MSNLYFKNFIKLVKNKRILIATHDLVDIDGLASCFSLKYFLNNYAKNQDVNIAFSEFSKQTKTFLNKFSEKFPSFPISYNSNINLANNDLLIILDTNNLNQVKSVHGEIDTIPYIFIDHHYTAEKMKMELPNLIFTQYSSTAEIVLELSEYFKIKFPKALRILLISAIIIDTGFFRHGNNQSFYSMAKLMNEEIKYLDILDLLKKDIDISKKIAKIKGMQRVELIREGKYLIGVTNVSSFGAVVASMLIRLGFDIAIVYSTEINRCRINTRAKKLICNETGLNLAEVLYNFSKKYNGNSGGHDGAAALEVDMGSGFNIQQVIESIKEYL